MGKRSQRGRTKGNSDRNKASDRLANNATTGERLREITADEGNSLQSPQRRPASTRRPAQDYTISQLDQTLRFQDCIRVSDCVSDRVSECAVNKARPGKISLLFPGFPLVGFWPIPARITARAMCIYTHNIFHDRGLGRKLVLAMKFII